jgi:hypothetical protein
MKKLAALLVVLAPAFAYADKTFTGGKGATWDCKKDPVVHINHGNGKYTFKGTCTTIDFGGGENTITIEAVDTLVVGSASNTITVGTVDTIDVGGSGNKITWKKAKTGDKPTLKGQPEKNTVTQAK